MKYLQENYMGVFLLMFTACAPAPDPDTQTTAMTYTGQGIALGASGGARLLDSQRVDDTYQIISACVANRYIKPDFSVITQENPIIINGVEVQGVTWSYSNRPDVVYIHYPYWRDEGIAISILSHEMIHVVLGYIGEPSADNTNHVSPAFQCAF